MGHAVLRQLPESAVRCLQELTGMRGSEVWAEGKFRGKVSRRPGWLHSFVDKDTCTSFFCCTETSLCSEVEGWTILSRGTQ